MAIGDFAEGRDSERQRDRETERQTGRQADRQVERSTPRETVMRAMLGRIDALEEKVTDVASKLNQEAEEELGAAGVGWCVTARPRP